VLLYLLPQGLEGCVGGWNAKSRWVKRQKSVGETPKVGGW